MMKKILVVAAHPDDEVLGCGGTIAKHTKYGDEVHVVIMAEGITSRSDSRSLAKDASALSELAKSAGRANEILGASSLDLLGFPDNRMDGVDRLDVVKEVERFLNKFQPEIVYTHHAGDVNVDHRVIHDAVVAACRPLPGNTVKALLFFEVASSTEWQPPNSAPAFSPNWFVDISETLDLKLAALRAYESEMRPWPHARSVEALEHLARWRGATIGANAAEAFIAGRVIA